MVDTSAMNKVPEPFAVHDPHTYGGRLGIAIEAAQVTVREVAKHLDVSPQSLYKVLRGDSKALQVANHLKVCRFLGVEPGWLSDARGSMTKPREIPLEGNEAYPAIRHVAITFSAGMTGYEVQQIDEAEAQPIVFKASWYRSRSLKPENLVAATVRGSSMEPTLYEGDLVVINLADKTPKDGEVFAARHEDELVLKRVFKSGGTWWLHSDNADQRRHPKREMLGESDILGRVVYRQSERL